jgi:hypothetical protein
MKTRQQRQSQYGAVSLFVVIFATLLMIVITISFIQLMIKDQQQATASDLSQSAYDSAKSGVEDAKRLLLLDQACRNNAAPAAVDCIAVAAAIGSEECNTVSVGLLNRSPQESEIMIQQDEGDKALQQAYTCVKIDAVTDDYKSILGVNQSNIIPLKGVSSFDKIKISWFIREDISTTTNSMAIGFPSSGSNHELPRAGAKWAVNYPALLRAQLMQTGANFTLADFDADKNASTLFLYPAAAGSSTADFTTVRRDGSQIPEIVDCQTSFSASIVYACEVTITLPNAAGEASAANRSAFLRLSALYNGANYKIELLNGGAVVPFDHVQPEVDSTGRANDMFRRVKNRIEFKSDFIYPEAAVDLEGDLCKSFVITDLDADYVNSPTCTP